MLQFIATLSDLPFPQQMTDNTILVEDVSDPNKLSNLAVVFQDVTSESLGNASLNMKSGMNF